MNKVKNTLFSNKPVTIDENSLIMAIESSCDETACAIVKGGREVLANVVASQIKIHEEFGGVILVNLFSVITNKLHMRWARDVDVNHPENDIYIQKAAEESSIVLLAYGKGVMNNIRIVNRINQVLTLLSKYQDKLMVISDGERSFLHPLTPSTRSVVWKLVPFSHEEHIILTKNRKKAVDETLIPEENANQEATAEEAKESVPT